MKALKSLAPTRFVLTSVLGAAVILSSVTAGATPTTQQSGTRSVAATAAGGTVSISGWATFSGVNIAAGTSKWASKTSQTYLTGADLIGAQLVYRPELADLYMRWQVQKIPSQSFGLANIVGSPGTLYGLKTSIAGVPIEIRASSQGATQTYQLWKCETEGVCALAGNLAGAFGTTGEEVIVTASLATLAGFGLPLNEGSKMSAPVAYTFNSPFPLEQIPANLYADQIVMAKTANVTVPTKRLTVTVGRTTKVAALNKGYFRVAFPRKAFRSNPSPLTTRTCLGPTCVTQRFTVRY